MMINQKKLGKSPVDWPSFLLFVSRLILQNVHKDTKEMGCAAEHYENMKYFMESHVF